MQRGTCPEAGPRPALRQQPVGLRQSFDGEMLGLWPWECGRSPHPGFRAFLWSHTRPATHSYSQALERQDMTQEGSLTFTLVTRDPSAFLIHAISSSVSFSERRSPAVQEEWMNPGPLTLFLLLWSLHLAYSQAISSYTTSPGTRDRGSWNINTLPPHRKH